MAEIDHRGIHYTTSLDDWNSYDDIPYAQKRLEAFGADITNNHALVKKRLDDRVDELGIRWKSVFNSINMNQAIYSHLENKDGTYNIFSSSLMRKVCYQELNISINSVIFGKAKPIVVPKMLECILKRIQTKPESELDRILAELKEMYSSQPADYEYTLPYQLVVRDRLKEHADELGTHFENQFDHRWLSGQMRIMINKIISHYDDDEYITSMQITLDHLAFWSYCLQVSLDYFLALDYSRISPVIFSDGNPIYGKLKDIVSAYLIAPYEVKKEWSIKMLCDSLLSERENGYSNMRMI